MRKNLPYLVAFAVIATLAVNALAVTLPLNGKTTAQLSDQYPVYFVPAGYVFAIWGLIYVGLAAFMLYQLMPKQREDKFLLELAPWVLLSCLANSAWIFLWHYELVGLSLLTMLILLISLDAIYYTILTKPKQAKEFYWFVSAPFAVYTGWISVAFISNLTVYLYSVGMPGLGFSGPIWASLMVLIAAGIALAFLIKYRDPIAPAVVVWALAGIYAKFPGTMPLAFVSLVSVVGLATALVVEMYLKRAAKKHK